MTDISQWMELKKWLYNIAKVVFFRCNVQFIEMEAEVNILFSLKIISVLKLQHENLKSFFWTVLHTTFLQDSENALAYLSQDRFVQWNRTFRFPTDDPAKHRSKTYKKSTSKIKFIQCKKNTLHPNKLCHPISAENQSSRRDDISNS